MKYNQVGLCLFSATGRYRPKQMREGVHLSLRNQRTPSTRGGLEQQRIKKKKICPIWARGFT